MILLPSSNICQTVSRTSFYVKHSTTAKMICYSLTHRIKPNYTVLIISVFHMILLCGGIYYTIVDLVDEEEPVQTQEIMYILMQVHLHVVIIVLLIYGVVKNKPLLILPWLLSVFIILGGLTALTLFYASFESFTSFLFNVILCGIHWTIWFTVFVYYKDASKDGGSTSNKLGVLKL